MSEVGTCKLCRRENVELQESHYMPAALYPKKFPLEYLSRAGIHPLTEEIKALLLCFCCEQRFSKYGESEVLRHIAGKIANKPSPILPRLEQLQVREEDESLKSYCGSDAGLNMDMFAYFALSVAWRSTHAWRTQDGRDTKPLSLGLFTEPIRQFLAGETSDFPKDVAVIVIVCSDKLSRQSWFLPTEARDIWVHDIKFHAFGVTFRIVLGKSMPPVLRVDSAHAAGKRIHVGNCQEKTREALQRSTGIKPESDGVSSSEKTR